MSKYSTVSARWISIAIVLILGLSGLPLISQSGDGAESAVAAVPEDRSVDYRWYDMFNVPFGEWWSKRWTVTHIEQPLTSSYPYIFAWHGAPPGNIYYYTNMRLNITGSSMPEINMNERPEFLPFFGTERGGNAVIDWYLQYLTSDECAAISPFIASWNDGWVVDLKGTVTLDRQAAKAVLGVTDAQFDNFGAWWTANNATMGSAYQSWIDAQSRGRLDIFPMYDYDLNFMDWIFWCEKVGTNVIIHMDSVSWGMEAMMTRWMHDSFMPTEWYFEDMDFHMWIGPTNTSMAIDTAVVYAAYAWETLTGQPCWAWEALLGDYVPSEPPLHQNSTFDNYMPFSYLNRAPGSQWYGQMMPYDYTPGAWNLSEGETLQIEWPTGPQVFICQAFDTLGDPIIGSVYNTTAEMMVAYSEPDETDTPANFEKGTQTVTFTGPIDLWNWSKEQTNHGYLESEWERMRLLPHGVPYIEWGGTPAPPQLSHLGVSGITSPATGGTPYSVTVAAFDQLNNIFTDYGGTVHFTSTNGVAELPADYQFVPSDMGVHTFVSSVIFHNWGTTNVTHSLTVTDTTAPSISGQQTGILVMPDPRAEVLELSSLPTTIVSGEPVTLTVTAIDQYGDVWPEYTGTIHFISNRSDVSLPQDYTFTLSDAGVHAFQLDFVGLGYYSLTCMDTFYAFLTTSKTGIFVAPSPSMPDRFVIYGPHVAFIGQHSDFTVVALDQYSHVFDTYAGTVRFSTNASMAQLPADTTFTLADQGNKTFVDGMTFEMPGIYEVSVSDLADPTITGSLVDILVTTAYPEIRYKIYDMFEEPFGQWWWGNSYSFKGRIFKYQTDSIVWNETHKHALLYNPDLTSQHAMIMAPYHWSMDATNISWVTVSNPYFMPTRYSDLYGRPAPTAEGAEVSMDLRMQYIDEKWWFEYWVPTLGDSPIVRTYCRNQGDGYLIGTVYNITMNREAAVQWLNLSLTEPHPADWWSVNGLDYEYFWRGWIWDQGNIVYDIFSGYEDMFYDNFCVIRMTEDPATGDIRLVINHVNWGFEVLMTRWLTAAQLNKHEPYWENLTLHATMNQEMSHVWFDATGYYNLRAVRSNLSSTNDGAWAWEPLKVDYVPSWFGSIWHHSDFDLYADRTYISRDAGDTVGYFGQPVPYTWTPGLLNLEDYMTFTMELPKGSDVPFFLGQPVPVGSVPRAKLPYADVTNYTALKYTGSATLGYTDPQLSQYYDPTTKTLELTGPMVFAAEGAVLDHGLPWIEIRSEGGAEEPHINAVGVVALADTIETGKPLLVNVTVFDQYNRVFTNYTGTIVLNSSDGAAVLPGPYAFTPADGGRHTFTVVLNSQGTQQIVAYPMDKPFTVGVDTVQVTPGVNKPPVAEFESIPGHGDSSTVFVFDASSSHDLESALKYRWDWESNGIWDTGWSSDPWTNHRYGHFGVYTVHLQVMDAGGLVDDALDQVSVGLSLAMKNNQKTSIYQWIYVPRNTGEFTLMVENHGLNWMKVGVVDITSGQPFEIAYMRIHMQEDTGIFAMPSFWVSGGHVYLFTASPLGHRGESALVYGEQALPPMPLVSFTCTVSGLTVRTDASFFPSQTIVRYEWDWGDGTTSAGAMATHTYASWGSWSITLIVTDIYGRTASVTHDITIS